jgi:hypothetical protein
MTTRKTFQIPFTREGKRFVATVEAASREEAGAKLRVQLTRERDEAALIEKDTEAKTLRLAVRGTHCASCEVLIERKFKKLPGVDGVVVN